MAGYCYQMGMSNNAVAAYCDGRCPASKIPGVPAALVREFAPTSEWHHTSKVYNRTPFYDPTEVRALFGLEPSSDVDPDPRAVAALGRWKATRSSVIVHKNCQVEWLEWTGTLSRPKCHECSAEGCMVEVKGQTAKVTFADGKVMKKRLTTRGFAFRSGVAA
jgi:hypothetical protein